MRSEYLRLSPRLRVWTYSTFGVLFASGLLWWILQRWSPTETEFGPAIHPAATWLLRLHGAASMLVLVILGILLPLHVRRAWRARKNRFSGAVMLALSGLLVATGWLLYYASGETLRPTASAIHLWAGLGLPLSLIVHIWLGRRARRQPQSGVQDSPRQSRRS
jgi:heme A synthase